jgi:structural maintenance of chromosomes protein 5
MEILSDQLARFNQQKANSSHNLQTLKNNWISALRDNVMLIDTAFARLFQKMGCLASVKLAETDDFATYGLEILVQFRKEDTLKVLSKETHSGGERSVSTMLYLLALQSVTEVPFRVVDEINQGMDPKNERMIFDRIVEQSNSSSAKQSTPQYFLVTPKLLPNLNYTAASNITVLFVFNGWYMLDGTCKFLLISNSFRLISFSQRLGS